MQREAYLICFLCNVFGLEIEFVLVMHSCFTCVEPLCNSWFFVFVFSFRPFIPHVPFDIIQVTLNNSINFNVTF